MKMAVRAVSLCSVCGLIVLSMAECAVKSSNLAVPSQRFERTITNETDLPLWVDPFSVVIPPFTKWVVNDTRRSVHISVTDTFSKLDRGVLVIDNGRFLTIKILSANLHQGVVDYDVE